jgi:hypothetical protein
LRLSRQLKLKCLELFSVDLVLVAVLDLTSKRPGELESPLIDRSGPLTARRGRKGNRRIKLLLRRPSCVEVPGTQNQEKPSTLL